MTESLIRLLGAIAPAIGWIATFVAAVVGLFALYVGIALVATLSAGDADIAKIRYRVLCKLLKVFRWRRQ